ncbi:MAG: BatD family protein [Planctomycetota bacterium]
MWRLARLATFFLVCGLALAQERAFVEVTAEKDAYYVGEVIRLKLRFGYDRDFFRTNAVPLFAREMEVPVQVQAQLPGRQTVNKNVHPLGPTFALNDGVMKANSSVEEMRDGRVFTIVESLYGYGRSEPGEVTIAAPTLRYGYATEFEEDFVSGRVPKDPKQEVVAGAVLTLQVLPLPEEGRPPEFDGAVGHFTVSADVNAKTVDVGKTLRLTFRIKGHGNAMKERLDLPGFHIYGTYYMDGGQTTVSNIAPLSADVKEIPGIPFAFFDPGPPAGYRVVRTDPIPLEVRGGPAPEPPAPPPARRDLVPIAAAVVAAAIAAVAIALWVQSRRRVAPPDLRSVRLAEALAALRGARPGPALADALADLLAAYLECPPAAVIGPDLSVRLAGRGLAPGLAARTAATLERLVAARYGGSHAGEEDLAALLPELEAALAATVRAGSPR